jgi:hypothetical protein
MLDGDVTVLIDLTDRRLVEMTIIQEE